MSEALIGITPQRADVPSPSLPRPAGRASPDAVQYKAAARSEGAAAAAATASEELPQDLFSSEKIAETLHQLNLTFDMFEIQAQFSVSDDNREIRVVLRNTRTGEVVRRIPPDEFILNFASFKDGIGLLYNRIF